MSSTDPDQAIADAPNDIKVVLAESIGAHPANGRNGSAGDGTVGYELRRLLSIAPDRKDPLAFEQALARAFTKVTDSDGFDRWVYGPNGVPATIELGELTGAQGSFYVFVKALVDESLELIAGLEPFVSESADDEAVTGTKAIAASLLRQFDDEARALGGPSAYLLDRIEAQLFGPTILPLTSQPKPAPNAVGGALEDLRERLHLEPEYIASLADEANYTRFLSLLQNAYAICCAWEDYDAGTTEYFGPTLYWLRLVFDAIAANVDEVMCQLDAVGVDASERKLMHQTVDGDDVYFEPFLQSLRYFVTSTTRDLIDSAGKFGALALYPQLKARSTTFKKAFVNAQGFATLYYTPLVEAAVATLSRTLDEATEILAKLGAEPSVETVIPLPGDMPTTDWGLPDLPKPRTPVSDSVAPISINLAFDIETMPAKSEVLFFWSKYPKGTELRLVALLDRTKHVPLEHVAELAGKNTWKADISSLQPGVSGTTYHVEVKTKGKWEKANQNPVTLFD